MIRIVKLQLINFIIYTLISLIFGSYLFTDEFNIDNISTIPILLFGCLIFLSSTMIIFIGNKIYKRDTLIIYLMPQLIGFLILIIITIGNKINNYSIGYYIDEFLWVFLTITTLLNFCAYFFNKR
jgi:hypothetical protein